MLNRPLVHELDSNAIYLRSIEINLHHKKLNAIRNRKNQFESEQSTTRYYKRFIKFKNQAERSTPYYGFHNCLAIRRDNRKMAEKLDNIQKRDNKTLLDDTITKVVNTRNKFSNSVRMLKQKQLYEDNRDFRQRLMNRSGFIDGKKLEEDFIIHQKIFNQLRRIKPRNRSCENYSNKINSYSVKINQLKINNIFINVISLNKEQLNSQISNPKLTKNKSMESLPPI